MEGRAALAEGLDEGLPRAPCRGGRGWEVELLSQAAGQGLAVLPGVAEDQNLESHITKARALLKLRLREGLRSRLSGDRRERQTSHLIPSEAGLSGEEDDVVGVGPARSELPEDRAFPAKELAIQQVRLLECDRSEVGLMKHGPHPLGHLVQVRQRGTQPDDLQVQWRGRPVLLLARCLPSGTASRRVGRCGRGRQAVRRDLALEEVELAVWAVSMRERPPLHNLISRTPRHI